LGIDCVGGKLFAFKTVCPSLQINWYGGVPPHTSAIILTESWLEHLPFKSKLAEILLDSCITIESTNVQSCILFVTVR
jgi:hypothetical protein